MMDNHVAARQDAANRLRHPLKRPLQGMLRHIVLFSAKDPADVPAIRDGLMILRDIPHARHLEVAVNERHDTLSDEPDVVVYGEFDDAEALAAYKAHPLYQESIRRVRPLRDMRVAVDYTVPVG